MWEAQLAMLPELVNGAGGDHPWQAKARAQKRIASAQSPSKVR